MPISKRLFLVWDTGGIRIIAPKVPINVGAGMKYGGEKGRPCHLAARRCPISCKVKIPIRVNENGNPEKKSFREERGLFPERIEPAAVVVTSVNK
jgi:hypothetical protein|nr:hypothetical protein [Leptospirillum ferriphilum]